MKKHPASPPSRPPIVHNDDESLAIGLLTPEAPASSEGVDTLSVIPPTSVPVSVQPKRLCKGSYFLSTLHISQQQAMVTKVYGDSEDQQDMDDDASAELASVFAPQAARIAKPHSAVLGSVAASRTKSDISRS
ncbi:hypothetical protein [Oleidesulfovibrio sp.]|uniref:hypothetical protein n=1 Tax=Oleidesulfovibrio sp. TaxID=2909707 RepID=UPI003A87A6F5